MSQKNLSLGKILAMAILAVAVVVIAIIFITNSLSGSKSTTSNDITAGATKTTNTIKDSDLVIKTSEVTDKAKFYPVEVNGAKLEVIAVKAPDNTIRTAFNTCQVCYSSGRGYYVQQGDALVCQNCGNQFGMGDVEVTKGGCNPVPITDENKTVDDKNITITKEFLSKSKDIFANWKN